MAFGMIIAIYNSEFGNNAKLKSKGGVMPATFKTDWLEINLGTVKDAPAPLLANAISVDWLRKLNPMEKPLALDILKTWREDVFDFCVKNYPQHCF